MVHAKTGLMVLPLVERRRSPAPAPPTDVTNTSYEVVDAPLDELFELKGRLEDPCDMPADEYDAHLRKARLPSTMQHSRASASATTRPTCQVQRQQQKQQQCPATVPNRAQQPSPSRSVVTTVRTSSPKAGGDGDCGGNTATSGGRYIHSDPVIRYDWMAQLLGS